MNRPDVLALFARQHWVASCTQLTALGVSPSAIDRARQRGQVVRMYRGVLAVAGAELSFEGRALALQLAAGAGAFVSGPSAAAMYGLREMPKRRTGGDHQAASSCDSPEAASARGDVLGRRVT